MISQNSSYTREEYLKKKRKKRFERFGIVLLLIILVISLASYVAHRSSIRISKVQLTGQILVEPTELATSALLYMDGSYLWLFPKNNFLWYPKDKLALYLQETFKRIDTIHIEKKGLDTIVVEITERKPYAIWGDTLPGEISGADARFYFMDSNSTIFAEAPSFSGDAYFKYYGLVGGEKPIGQFYIGSSTAFSEIARFVQDVEDLHLDPQYIVANGGEFSLVIAGGGRIYFDVKESLAKAIDNLEALVRTDALMKNISNLDYIDLRFGNKLYYKLK